MECSAVVFTAMSKDIWVCLFVQVVGLYVGKLGLGVCRYVSCSPSTRTVAQPSSLAAMSKGSCRLLGVVRKVMRACGGCESSRFELMLWRSQHRALTNYFVKERTLSKDQRILVEMYWA